jgi:2-polyprenyl-3-methyl-5-hydroxy-6-metoxy-1,4-benzoquinol methylase
MTIIPNTRVCWCGNADLLPFSPEYSECSVCGTLVYLKELPPEQLLVRDDETDFYGKKYWLEHQQEAFGYADIHTRARNDLTERNLHWLKTLLKYCLPPAKVLELGCSHGSFVVLLKQAGYDASGMEMSPWVVEFGQKTFGVPISIGPIEALDITSGSLDVIALMDVLEHLPNPVETMAHCLKLLKPGGLMLIQTPQFKEGMNYATLLEKKGAFLEQLKADEHLYLFSDRSVTRLFQQLGADHIQFEPAIFAIYDMFFAVNRVPLVEQTREQIEAALLATPNGRLSLALLDLREHNLELTQKQQEFDSVQADRASRLEVIYSQQSALAELQGRFDAVVADRVALLETINFQQAEITNQQAEITKLKTLRGLAQYSFDKLRSIYRIKTTKK